MGTPTWALGAVLSGLLASRPAWGTSKPVGVIAGIAGALAWALVVPRERPAGVAGVATVGTCSALAFVGYTEAFGLDFPLAPAFAQAHGQTVMLLLRVGLLLAILTMFEHTPEPTERLHVRALALVSSLFLISLVARGALIPFLASAMAVFRWLDRRTQESPAPKAAWFASVIGLLALLPTDLSSRPRQLDADDPHRLVARWRADGNLWRARWCALHWASTEAPPGEGYLALAEADWDLGRHDTAERVVAKVLLGAAPEDVRRRAEVLQRLWTR